MVSAGICFTGKGRLHFVAEKAKINSKYYTEELLPLLIEDCRMLLHNEFVFSKTEHQRTLLIKHKTGCNSTRMTSSAKISGLLTHQI